MSANLADAAVAKDGVPARSIWIFFYGRKAHLWHPALLFRTQNLPNVALFWGLWHALPQIGGTIVNTELDEAAGTMLLTIETL